MTTAIDTSVIVALWGPDVAVSSPARVALESAADAGLLVVAAPVFSELMAAPGRSDSFLDRFLGETGITVEWELGEGVWRLAGRAFQASAARRRRHRDPGPRRILADFLIGAHASQRGYRLLTLDQGFYRLTFPDLIVLSV